MSRSTKYIPVLAVVALSFLAILVFPHKTVFAVGASDWRPGNIIDDGTFFDSGSMSTTEIQNFLNSKVPACDTNGSKTSEYGGGTRAQYASSKGYPPPYTCLKSYSQGGVSAAQIIKNAANTYNISPKVLLVLLQKEQTLVTDDWPWPSQYRSATGYGCPDTAPCDAEYYGFTNQVTKAAYQFRRYATYPNDYRYKPFQTNYIQYNPNAGCGGSNVYIENLATAGLYNYTPYQPNASALSNLYGSGDSCGAYGNRNFWRLYSDWFGSTQSTPFFSNSGKVYVDGANNSYYYVPNPDILNAYGVGSVINSMRSVDSNYLQGRTYAGVLPRVARFNDLAIYVFDGGRIHQFQNESDYHAYGYNFGDEAVLPSSIKWHYSESTPMRTVLKLSGMPDVYLIESGKKRHIGNWASYTTLGSPTYNTRSSVTLSSSFASSIPSGKPVLVNGSIVKNTTTGAYSYVIDGTNYAVNAAQFPGWGLAVDYQNSNSVVSLFTQSVNQATGSLVKSNTGTYYILDSGKKRSVSSPDIVKLGLSAGTFQTVPDTLLGKFGSSTMSTLLIQTGKLAVYEAKNGQLYHIYSEDDLRGLGYNWSQLTTIREQTMDLLHDSGLTSFRTGRLVRVTNSAPVYVIDGSSKRHVPNEDTFNQYGYSWGGVAVISAGQLTGYTDATAISRYARDSGGAYWLINGGKKLAFSTQLIGEYGLNVSSFVTEGQIVLDNISTVNPVTNLVRASNNLKVFKVESGTRRWITSETAFNSNGLSWSNVRVLAPSFVDSIPTGNNIN